MAKRPEKKVYVSAPGARKLVALVGRPNVGKSTLFNRLVGRRLALVEDTPGVTRDRRYADAELDDRPVTIIDTGGFVPQGAFEDPLGDVVRQQAQAAVEACDVVLFVTDGRTGPTSGDEEVARYLRKQSRPIVLVVNKVDQSGRADELTAEFHRLGLGDPVAVSAEHNLGVGELVQRITPHLGSPAPVDSGQGEREGREPPEREKGLRGPDPDRPIRISIVGRPNVGKSTLVNALLGEERVVVSPVAGTTRDPIDSPFEWKGRKMVLTDTAGIRRKSVVLQNVEHFSVLAALRAVEDSDVAVLVIDASEAGVEQDLKIAALAEEKGRALLICVNKWDLAKGEHSEENFRKGLKWELTWVSYAPMVFVTAKEGQRVTKVLDVAVELFDQQHFRAPTPVLNRLVEHVTTEHPLPVIDRRPLKIYYAAQVATAPPAFAFTVNTSKPVPDKYQRYVANRLRETFRLKVPLRLFWRNRPGESKRKDAAARFKARAQNKRKRGRPTAGPRRSPTDG